MNNTKDSWRLEYKRLYDADLKKRSPVFYDDSVSPGDYIVWPKIGTANGLTKAICNFIRWKGFYANRINTQGQSRVQKIPKYNLSSGRVEYLEKSWRTKSMTRKGTADIDAIITGRPVKIEVKIGADKISGDQKEEKARVEAAGGIYFVAKEMQQFYDWYTKQFEGNHRSTE